MIDDPNIEHEDKPEYDEDGNQIWYMPVLPSNLRSVIIL